MRTVLTFVLTFLYLASAPALAQAPIVHLRADQRLDRTSDGHVQLWQSVSGSATFVPDTTKVRPLVVDDAINGRPAIRFANDGYLEGPAVFPTQSDYTLYVVMRWDGKQASNNLVSGTTRALFLATSPYPRVIHQGNFSQMSQSTIGADGPTVVRVEFEHASGRLRLALNNRVGDEAVIPANTDPTIYIGSYVRGNFFWGDIAEVVIYDRQLDSAARATFEQELHQRYGIGRMPDPPPPVVQWQQAPSHDHFIPEGGSLVLRGTIIDAAVRRVAITLDSAGIVVDQWVVDAATTTQISIERQVTSGLHHYRLSATAQFTDGTERSVLEADGIVSGIAIAIEGQSNSIFGDATLTTSPFARTIGSNAGRQLSDTLFKSSIATGNGGGANVGAWGLRLQHLIASELGQPSCVINGGVGGTRIEQHFPDANNRMNLATIYGSWLYRIEKSGLRDHIRWLFWYQGESNNGADGYGALFDQLYAAWKSDLPNLERIVVIQIRPGCGGTEHARLRDDQRRLQDRYSDVIVHTACALPGHDGCHFQSAGYRQLADQLFRLYRDLEAGQETSAAQAPTIDRVRLDVQTKTISISVRHSASLYPLLSGSARLADAFFLNDDESIRPDSAWIQGTTIVIQPPSGVAPVTVSYVPSKNDPVTNAVFQGPWITDELGVGLLSFHSVPVIPSTVSQAPHASTADLPRVVRRGVDVTIDHSVTSAHLVSIHGATIPLSTAGSRLPIPPEIAPGVYTVLLRGALGVQRQLIAVVE